MLAHVFLKRSPLCRQMLVLAFTFSLAAQASPLDPRVEAISRVGEIERSERVSLLVQSLRANPSLPRSTGQLAGGQLSSQTRAIEDLGEILRLVEPTAMDQKIVAGLSWLLSSSSDLVQKYTLEIIVKAQAFQVRGAQGISLGVLIHHLFSQSAEQILALNESELRGLSPEAVNKIKGLLNAALRVPHLSPRLYNLVVLLATYSSDQLHLAREMFSALTSVDSPLTLRLSQRILEILVGDYSSSLGLLNEARVRHQRERLLRIDHLNRSMLTAYSYYLWLDQKGAGETPLVPSQVRSTMMAAKKDPNLNWYSILTGQDNSISLELDVHPWMKETPKTPSRSKVGFLSPSIRPIYCEHFLGVANP